jgi:protein deglycase
MPSVLLPIADGSEELELVTIIDVLRRAAIEVTVASLTGEMITGSQGTKIVPDTSLEAAQTKAYDLVVLPGGLPGTNHLNNDVRIHAILKSTIEAGKTVGAICAAPKVLATAGLLEGKRATCYPGFLDDFAPEIVSTEEAVEWDGNVVTSRGPGTAMDFALQLIEVLTDVETRNAVEAASVPT